MHFVARSSLDTAYNAQSYTLRQDPLVIFRQPPMHVNNVHQRSMSISGAGVTSPHHKRSTSAGSFKQMHLLRNHDEDVTSSDPLLRHTIEETPETTQNHIDHTKDHDCESSGCKRVVLNVAGQKFETQIKTISRLPSTLLGDPEKRKRHWDPKRKEYFFDRHRPSFPAILYYYQSGGRLKRPVEVPLDIFLEELEFYELGQTVINAFKASEGLRDPGDDEFGDDGSIDGKPDGRGLSGTIWRTFELPGSTVMSTIVAIASVLFILTSICTYCIETLPHFKNSDCLNLTVTDENGTVTGSRMYPNFTHPLFLIETCCIMWFVMELILRAATCPSILKFVRDFSNIVDCVSILPYFLFFIMFFVNNSCDNNSKFFSVLRVFRVARIFKLGRFSEGLQILGKTLQVSISELAMFVLFLGIGVVIFAAAIFFVESQNQNSFFVSIPDSFWWAVISMTTVGYGDVYPISLAGKMIGSMCVLSGLLAIALPVPVIVTNFNNIYRQSTGRGNNL